MPNEDDDKDHAKEIKTTTTMVAATTSVTHTADTPDSAAATATGHPDRPTKIKPSGSIGASVASGTSTASVTAPASDPNWISWLPSFGVGRKAQVWIYGAIALILAFCIGLGVWLFMARRRKIRNNPRDTYEFEPLNEEESEGLNGGEKGAGSGNRPRRTRGGELYDAFAGGSDDEEDFEEQYRDQEQSGRSAAHRRLDDDDDDAEQQHVIGDDSDDDETDEKHQAAQPLRGGQRR